MGEDLDAVDFHYFIEAFELRWTHFGLAFVNLATMRRRLPLGGLYRCARGVIERRTEFADGEVVEGAEAAGELGVGQAALAVELAKMIRGGVFAFQRIALHACQDEVAVGIALELDTADDSG